MNDWLLPVAGLALFLLLIGLVLALQSLTSKRERREVGLPIVSVFRERGQQGLHSVSSGLGRWRCPDSWLNQATCRKRWRLMDTT